MKSPDDQPSATILFRSDKNGNFYPGVLNVDVKKPKTVYFIFEYVLRRVGNFLHFVRLSELGTSMELTCHF